jgi:hypothetical protein
VIEILFLGYIMSTDSVHMEQSRVVVIISQSEPRSVKDAQILLGFTNYYRHFFASYSKLAMGMTSLLRKYKKKCDLTPAVCASFDALKLACTSAPLLRHIYPGLPITLQTDASNFALGRTIS